MMTRLLVLVFAVSAVLFASPALADNQGQGGQDQTPLPPAAAPAPAAAPTTAAAPTPAPVVNTGGNVSSSNPGSGCSERLGVRDAPLAPSNMFGWGNNGDVGWPFGWPGMAPPNAIPTTAPSVVCSR